jgi:hypothetical protein
MLPYVALLAKLACECRRAGWSLINVNCKSSGVLPVPRAGDCARYLGSHNPRTTNHLPVSAVATTKSLKGCRPIFDKPNLGALQIF